MVIVKDAVLWGKDAEFWLKGVISHTNGQKLENKQEKGHCFSTFPNDVMPPTLQAPHIFSYSQSGLSKSMFSANF